MHGSYAPKSSKNCCVWRNYELGAQNKLNCSVRSRMSWLDLQYQHFLTQKNHKNFSGCLIIWIAWVLQCSCNEQIQLEAIILCLIMSNEWDRKATHTHIHIKRSVMVTWACDKFHNYILGREFVDETDQKTLVPLLTSEHLNSLLP